MSEDICNTCMYSTHLESNWIWVKTKVICTKTGKDMRKPLSEGKVECYMCKPRKGCVECMNYYGVAMRMDDKTYVRCAVDNTVKITPQDVDLVCDHYIPIHKPIETKEAKE